MDDMREHPYINVSGAALNSNKTDSFFKLNTPQYTSHYKANWNLSILPIQANFNSSKYKTKKPIPSNNTYISIEGFLENVETDSVGLATCFNVSMDNINFLGRANLSSTTNPGASFVYLTKLVFQLKEEKGKNKYYIITYFTCTPVLFFPRHSSGKC